jgi:hypothetical protein
MFNSDIFPSFLKEGIMMITDINKMLLITYSSLIHKKKVESK